MSVDFNVPLLMPFNIAEVIATVEREVPTFLNVQSAPRLSVTLVQKWQCGEPQPDTPVLFVEEGDSFTSVDLRIGGNGGADIMSYLAPWSPFGEEVLVASVSPRGEPYEGGLVLAALCSIVLARLARTFIRDENLLSQGDDKTAEALFEKLRCHHEHWCIESAMHEVIARIRRQA